LAEAAGVSSRTVQRAENGEEMSGETLQALASVFDLSVAVLRQPMPSEDEIRKAAEEAERFAYSARRAVIGSIIAARRATR
jgi:HTH-type transcriptional regulator, competence development regulator